MTDADGSTEYKGHTILITAWKSHNEWRWSYVLNGNSMHELRGRGLSSDELAIAEAQDDARRRIDAMP